MVAAVKVYLTRALVVAFIVNSLIHYVTSEEIQKQDRDKRGNHGSSQLSPALLFRLAAHQAALPQQHSSQQLHLLLGAGGSHQSTHYGPTAADIAKSAAGEATAAAAFQKEAAYKAAHAASKKVAAQVSAAARKAQDAAARKYAQAAHLTQAAQLSQALVFKEASQAAQTGKTVQAAEAIKVMAHQQLLILQEALAAAEAQAAVAEQITQAAAQAYWNQVGMLKQAQHAAQQILQRQSLSVNDLGAAQLAAQKAQSAATKASYRAQGTAGYKSHG